MTHKPIFVPMGKTNNTGNQDQALHGSVLQGQSNSDNWFCWCNCIGFKCLFVVVLSVAVFLSAVFWLPPFLQFADRGDLDPAFHYKGHEIVASFYLRKPDSFLRENILQLKEDIFNEIGVPHVKVLILHLKASAGSNVTRVVFGVDSKVKHTKIPETLKSLIKSTFQYLVTKQLSLRLSTPLFGEPFSFEVLKFPGGIIIIPPQSAFLLQKLQIPFNFTLNFSIHQLQASFGQLSSQLKSGLRLAPYENLYIRLSNPKGSTVSPPTTVYSSVLLEVGNSKSGPRLKQLAQTINGSNSGNLGLNNTEFGKVKGVSLSSILQHSLNGSDHRSSGSSPSPAPSPNPQPDHHYHRHHYHHRHSHHAQVSPAVSPEPAHGKGSSASHMGALAPRSSPGPQGSYEAKPPGCNNGHRHKSSRNNRKRSFLAPAVPPEMPHRHNAPSPAPTMAPKILPHYGTPAPSIAQNVPSRHAGAPPQRQIRPGAPDSISASSPLPSVQFPSNGQPNGAHSVATPPVKSSDISSAADLLNTIRWPFVLCLVVLYQLSSS